MDDCGDSWVHGRKAGQRKIIGSLDATVLVGRDAELARLRTALQKAKR
jgi:hypothetical protein